MKKRIPLNKNIRKIMEKTLLINLKNKLTPRFNLSMSWFVEVQQRQLLPRP